MPLTIPSDVYLHCCVPLVAHVDGWHVPRWMHVRCGSYVQLQGRRGEDTRVLWRDDTSWLGAREDPEERMDIRVASHHITCTSHHITTFT